VGYLRDVRTQDATTVFLTTHYLEEAEEADRVCVIDHGKIAMIGTPDEMKRQLLDRAILLDASDRPTLMSELLRPRPRPDARRDRPRPRHLRRRDGTTDHLADPDAAVRPPRPRPKPRGSLRGTPPAPRRGGSRMTTQPTPQPAAPRPAPDPVAASAREVNATFAIAWREILRAVKSPGSLAFTSSSR
jgi:ABC-type glutathione transport system ATPase component